MLFRLILVPVVLGGVLFFIGFNEWRLATKARPTPQSLTAAQLEAQGPGDNANVVLSNFLMCEWSFVYEAKKSGANAEWRWVWIPVVPLDSPYAQRLQGLPPGATPPPPDQIRIIVKSNKARSEGDVHNLAMAGSFQGMVVNEIESLGSEEKKLLAESYPGIEFSKCWIVQVDRKPAGSAHVMGMMGGGGMLALLGVAALIGMAQKGA